MEKLFPVEKICRGHVEGVDLNALGGSWIKNTIGIIVSYKDEKIFYSILDDCYFKIVYGGEILSYEECMLNKGKIFVKLYENDNLSRNIYNVLKKDYVTKEEIIDIKEEISGHFSDFDYDGLNRETLFDYEDIRNMEKYYVETELDYEIKIDRPLCYLDGDWKVNTNKRLIR